MQICFYWNCYWLELSSDEFDRIDTYCDINHNLRLLHPKHIQEILCRLNIVFWNCDFVFWQTLTVCIFKLFVDWILFSETVNFFFDKHWLFVPQNLLEKQLNLGVKLKTIRSSVFSEQSNGDAFTFTPTNRSKFNFFDNKLWNCGSIVKSFGDFFAHDYHHACFRCNASNLYTAVTLRIFTLVSFLVTIDTWCKSTKLTIVEYEQLIQIMCLFIIEKCSSWLNFSEDFFAFGKIMWFCNYIVCLTINWWRIYWELFLWWCVSIFFFEAMRTSLPFMV